MFEKVLLNVQPICYPRVKEFRTCVFAGGTYMEQLKTLLSKLDEDNDLNIIRQLCAILYRYLEKRGRL